MQDELELIRRLRASDMEMMFQMHAELERKDAYRMTNKQQAIRIAELEAKLIEAKYTVTREPKRTVNDWLKYWLTRIPYHAWSAIINETVYEQTTPLTEQQALRYIAYEQER